VIGSLSSVVDDSVQFYWDFLAKDTIAEGAILAFERIPGLLRCDDCGQTCDMPVFEAGGCPGCGGAHMRIIDGDQFRLESIEIEEA